MEKRRMSWGGVIVWLLFFWPVGLYFVYKKQSKNKYLMSGKTSAIAFCCWFCILTALLIGILPERTITDSLVGAAFLVGGILLFIKIRNIKKTELKYLELYDLIENKKITSIDNISTTTNQSYEETLVLLQKMIDLDCLDEYSIDTVNRVLKSNYPLKSTIDGNQGIDNGSKKCVVKCSNCGAENYVVVGQSVECEYCGSKISAI